MLPSGSVSVQRVKADSEDYQYAPVIFIQHTCEGLLKRLTNESLPCRRGPVNGRHYQRFGFTKGYNAEMREHRRRGVAWSLQYDERLHG
jgi:hypothetical protein